MGNGKTLHGNSKAIRNVEKIKPTISKEVKQLLKNHPKEDLIRQAITWLGYKKVTIKEYNYLMDKMLGPDKRT